MLTVGEQIIATCIDLDYQGQGVVKDQDYVLFVKGLLIGEKAKIKITKIKKSFGEGQIIEILESSKDRVSHPQTILGSCDLLMLTPEQQLKWQERITKETMKKILLKDLKMEPIITDQKDKYYRNKSVFHVMKRPHLTLGLYHKDDHRLIQVNQFILADEKTNEILSSLNEKGIHVDSTILKHIIVRTNAQGEALVTLVAEKKIFLGLNAIIDHLLKLEKIVGITLNINRDPNTILGLKSIVEYGVNRIKERLNGIDLLIDDRSFFQINLPVIEKAYQMIKSYIKPNQTVIDAYSGIGSIGFYIQDVASKIIMIESHEPSVKIAEEIKETNHFKHIDIVLGNAEDEIKNYQADLLILDPPRNGLMPSLLETLKISNFKKIFYVSCNAKTLARDLKELDGIYEIEKIYPIKMFYHTTSLETLVILNKN